MKRLFCIVLIALIVLFQSVASFATDINFGWEYSAADTADITGGGFTLWYGTASAGPFIKISTVNNVNARAYTLLSIETIGLTANSYWFTMRAFRAGGTPESANATPIQWFRPTTTSSSSTTTSVKPTTTSSSSSTTTSIKPVAPITGLTATSPAP